MLSKMKKPEIGKLDAGDLDKCKVKDLKEIAKSRGLCVTGKKAEIKQRIEENIKQHNSVRKIQSRFRGLMTRRWFSLKRTTSASPVNESDFYTLEPLNEMEFIYYIDYVDEKNNTTYVFNMNSLLNLVLKTGALVNPYTRDKMDVRLLYRLIEVIHYTYILFPNNDIVNHLKLAAAMTPLQVQQQQDHYNLAALPLRETTNYATLANELFMKIDELGNYTNIGWFNNLSNRQLSLFLVRMYHFWSKIDENLRRQICPRRILFSTANLGIEQINNSHRTLEESRALVIRIGETLVYDGVEREHRVMGAMYFLTGLTVVSMEARQEMPWLYDNYFVITQMQPQPY
jgi:hypothetical protein